MYCGKFLHRRGLKRHIEDIHSDQQQERRQSCAVCQRSFKNGHYLKNHMRVTHGIYSNSVKY
jgi:hypothetical protein